MKYIKFALSSIAVLSLVASILFFTVGPSLFDSQMNAVVGDPGVDPTVETLRFHETLVIGDLHADTALWSRSIVERANRGHVDVARMLEGNFALQMFTTVTKSPRGQNLHENSTDALDNISLLALAQRWPAATRDSLTERALYQAARIKSAALSSPSLQLVTNRNELENVIELRKQGTQIIGALLGTEGSHALDGKLENIDRLFDAGFRMMSLQHFFDNKLGGSLHGETKQGLTQFGEQAVDRMLSKGIMIDVAHSSEAVVRDVLARSNKPLIVSHTGFKGHCDTERNISDETMGMVAKAGGLIGVGYWGAAVCDQSVGAIVMSLRYGIDTFGLEHIALGSDWDGAVHTPIDAANIARLTQAMLDAEFSETEIRAVMGGNMLRFLLDHLPRA
jgi:microsomal dipeptidase-like Zn-dependent dipeptidase